MSTLEYMEKQVKKHTINYERETRRGAPQEILDNIKLKIGHYEVAVKALLEYKPVQEELTDGM